jgi:lipopolysaccharide heptosyltransferase I
MNSGTNREVRMKGDLQPAATQRILIVRPSALGDVCRTVPVLATLRQALPHAEIDWLVQDSFVEAIAAHPALSAAVPFPRGRFARWWRSPPTALEIIRWVLEVRRRSYDTVYDLQGLSRSGAITRFTGAGRRVGFRDARELGWLGYNVRHPAPRSPHIVDQMLELMEREGFAPLRNMRLHTPPVAAAWWDLERRRHGVPESGSYAVLAPTSRWKSKRWPIERWAALVDPLLARGFDRIVIIGGPDERAQAAPLLARPHPSVISMVGATSVGQTMAIIDQAGLVIANDSAPLHMAVGFDRPLLGLFGPTDPAFVGPYQRQDAVLRVHDPERDAGMHFRRSENARGIMDRISVDLVLERLDSLYGQCVPPSRTGGPALAASGSPRG